MTTASTAAFAPALPSLPALGRTALTRCAVAGGTLALLFAGIAGTASAAPLTSTDSVLANVEVSSLITLSALTTDFTLTGLPGATVASVGAVTMNVETNNTAGYTVTVQPADDVLVPADTAVNPDTIGIGALSVRETGTTGYTPLDNTTPTTVHGQATRSASGGDVISNDYSVAIPFVNADTYSVTLNYVATSS